jgi:hypothetical protein
MPPHFQHFFLFDLARDPHETHVQSISRATISAITLFPYIKNGEDLTEQWRQHTLLNITPTNVRVIIDAQ